ncbi:hypothetical protein [Nitrosomonas ureae]|uniref:YopA central domain-containing protein n=1 Tax=Nitrosomonas ureae TaxID=44577 RepID=A0A0S3AHD0_9PROT|nr:hypothetical protein [Nitrosomonas ureae]ALQ50312.1 hypothetical protein ATY38_03125 [Nitrosomonas ureae]SDT95102.1 hypothetical protein SAMN05216406_11322 [Nitrosomonas ureae]SEP66407.1 hypothetical protein SAMN05421510_1001160 [Nitrosomonas ureae]
MTNTEYQLKPLFNFGSESSIVLHNDVPASISINGKIYQGSSDVRLDLLPQAGIHFYGSFHDVLFLAFVDRKAINSFSINDIEIKGFFVPGGDPETGKLFVKCYPNLGSIIGMGNDGTLIERIIFHLFNFVDFMGNRRSSEPNGTGIETTIEHMDLICDEWKIELKSLLSTKENINFLRENGGYRSTHIGSIQKQNGFSFTGSDANECLTALRYFLSFIKGGWCNPICSVGFDVTGERVWEQWSSPREAWYKPFSWFDAQNTKQLTSLFCGFMRLWRNADWQGALKEIIYWYLNANFSSRGIDAGIILTQAAIERLSYEYAVKAKRLVTVDGFKNLWASDKFRLLFSSLRIPLNIPPETSSLGDLARSQGMKWIDAPHALTEIRNSLIHPEHKKRGQLDSAYFDAWNLGLWYLEMGILAICNYEGAYGNRLKLNRMGEVENVPWS